MLYQQSFVMYDRQTQSLWVHATGRAETGPLAGQQLTLLPATVTTWEVWKAAYPNTLVLSGHRRGGFMGTYQGGYQPRQFGLTVLVDFKAKLYPFAALQRYGVVNDHFRDTALVVAYFPHSHTATAWKRWVARQSLTFVMSAKGDAHGHFFLQDTQTESLWSGMTGIALEGTLKGQQLEQVSHHPMLIDRFHAFYPEGALFK